MTIVLLGIIAGAWCAVWTYAGIQNGMRRAQPDQQAIGANAAIEAMRMAMPPECHKWLPSARVEEGND